MVDAIATRNAQQAIAFFINKNADEAGELTLNLISPIAASNVTAFELTGTSVFATSITGDTWQKVDRITVEDGRLRTQLKAFSIMMLKFQLV